MIKRIWHLIKKAWNHKPREIVPHHDSRTNSHYQISQQALRDARKY